MINIGRTRKNIQT